MKEQKIQHKDVIDNKDLNETNKLIEFKEEGFFSRAFKAIKNFFKGKKKNESTKLENAQNSIDSLDSLGGKIKSVNNASITENEHNAQNNVLFQSSNNININENEPKIVPISHELKNAGHNVNKNDESTVQHINTGSGDYVLNVNIGLKNADSNMLGQNINFGNSSSSIVENSGSSIMGNSNNLNLNKATNFRNVKSNEAEKQNFLNSIKVDVDISKITEEKDREEFLRDIEANPEKLQYLSVERLAKLSEYYDKIIAENDRKIAELKVKLAN